MNAAPQLLAGKLDATHWSIRSMAGVTGFSHTTIRRIWAAFGLQPHRSETFKLSTDPLFVDKVRDIVGLYLSPPNRALVLSVDEKSQIHALDREQPVLPMMLGVPERQTHSYVRHGTTSLFAALDIASGFVIGKCSSVTARYDDAVRRPRHAHRPRHRRVPATGLAGTKLAAAACGTIRLKLLKIGALVTTSVRRVKLAFASACPELDVFELATRRL